MRVKNPGSTKLRKITKDGTLHLEAIFVACVDRTICNLQLYEGLFLHHQDWRDPGLVVELGAHLLARQQQRRLEQRGGGCLVLGGVECPGFIVRSSRGRRSDQSERLLAGGDRSL